MSATSTLLRKLFSMLNKISTASYPPEKGMKCMKNSFMKKIIYTSSKLYILWINEFCYGCSFSIFYHILFLLLGNEFQESFSVLRINDLYGNLILFRL